MSLNHVDQTTDAATIEMAQVSDLAAVLNLLKENGLPPEGLRDHVATTLVAKDGQRVIGSAALELYGSVALLRSVAVAAAFRGQGLGQRLTQTALALAQQHGVSQVYLLTETAGDFFPRLGFQVIKRGQVPAAVQDSLEFTSLCPDSALAMVYQKTAAS